MTLTTQKLKKNQKTKNKKQMFFAEIFLTNILIYCQKLSAKVLRFWSKKMTDFTQL